MTTAAVIEVSNGDFVLDEIQLDDPRPDEILVRVVASGLCHSDLSARSQDTPFPLPAVLGHEGAGIVEEVGDHVLDLERGDAVVVSFSSCGACPACLRSSPVYCRHWLQMNLLGGCRLDGSATMTRAGGALHGNFFGQSSLARKLVTKARAAVRVDANEHELKSLGPLACGIQTGTTAVLDLLRPEPGTAIAIFGAGGVGLSAVMAARLTPVAQIIVIDPNPERRELARDLGASETLDPAAGDPIHALRDLTNGDGVRYAVECSGLVPVLHQAFESLAAEGTVCVIGAPALGTEAAFDVTNILGRGLKIVGTNQGGADPKVTIPALVDLHRRGHLPFDRLVEHFELGDINKAASRMQAGSVVKPVLTMD